MSRPNRRPAFSVAGLIVAFAGWALIAVWLASSAVSPPKPTEVVIVDNAERIGKAAWARIRGIPYEAPRQEAGTKIGSILVTALPLLGEIALAGGVIGLLRREDRRICGAAICLGSGLVYVLVELAALAMLALCVIAIGFIAIMLGFLS